jgi:Capsule assembly protein Wzi/PAP2 superfamily
MGRWFWLMVLGATLATNAWGQASPAGASARLPDPPKKAAVAPTIHIRSMKPDTQGEYTPGAFLHNVAGDQKAIWTSPARLHVSDLGWLVPLAGVGASLLATDSETSRHLSNSRSRINHSSQISNYGLGALGGAAGGMYLWGKLTHNPHEQETGFLAIESLANAFAVNEAVNFAAGRERPDVDNARGRFGVNGRSFPSNHAVAAWSVASVVAHEYPGLLTKLLAYGLAGAVSASRVSAKQHFPSDVFFGSAIGWLIGEEVYRAHHDPEVGGGVWNTFREMTEGEGQAAGSRASAFVPLDSWVYPALERLVAEGYVRTAMLGMRPWTRTECARLVGEAEDRINAEEKDPPKEVARVLGALEREFAGELGSGGGKGLELTSLYTRVMGISGKPLTDGYHFGQTIVNDNGRPYEEGANAVAGFTAQALAGPFVVYVNGEFQHAPSAPALPQAARSFISRADGLPSMPALPTRAVNRFDVVEGYVGFAWHNWQITAGKQSLWWGPGEGGSMMYSDNAEPMNMIRITRVSPFKLPSIFGLLGPMRVEFFIGQQHGAQFIDTPTGLVGQWGRELSTQPIIHGQKISFKPTPNLEFGFDRTTVYGGPGFPLTGHTFFRSLFSTTNEVAGAPNKPGDRRSGFDMTYRLPGLRNWVTFYADSYTDDEFTPVAYFDRSANSAGLYFPRLPKLDQWDLRLEGVYTDNPISSRTSGNLCCGFYYSNGTWRYGYRNDGNLIGSWVGRDGQGFEGWLGRSLGAQGRLEFSYRHQKVSGQFIPGGGTVNDGGASANFWLRPNLSVTASLQYEQWKFPVLAAGAQTNVTSSVQVTFWPRWRVR